MDWRAGIRQRWKLVLANVTAVVLATAVVGGGVACLAVWISGGAFDWTLAAGAATAFGTTALAVATGLLAWETLANVRATQDDVRTTAKLAELAERDQAERHRPVVVLLGWNSEITSPPGLRAVADDGTESTLVTGRFVWQFRKVGVGPALDVALSIAYEGERPVSFTPDTLRRRVAMPDEPGRTRPSSPTRGRSAPA
jgi:hypothetical protein